MTRGAHKKKKKKKTPSKIKTGCRPWAKVERLLRKFIGKKQGGEGCKGEVTGLSLAGGLGQKILSAKSRSSKLNSI